MAVVEGSVLVVGEEEVGQWSASAGVAVWEGAAC